MGSHVSTPFNSTKKSTTSQVKMFIWFGAAISVNFSMVICLKFICKVRYLSEFLNAYQANLNMVSISETFRFSIKNVS